MSTTTQTAMASLVASLADNKAALGRRYADWAVSAPTLRHKRLENLLLTPAS